MKAPDELRLKFYGTQNNKSFESCYKGVEIMDGLYVYVCAE